MAVESAEIRQCWAFHRNGARCEHPAGHPGNHAVTKTWTDTECITPGKPAETPTPARGLEVLPPPIAAAPVLAPVIDKCVACNHQHKSGPCKCGCFEQIA